MLTSPRQGRKMEQLASLNQGGSEGRAHNSRAHTQTHTSLDHVSPESLSGCGPVLASRAWNSEHMSPRATSPKDGYALDRLMAFGGDRRGSLGTPTGQMVVRDTEISTLISINSERNRLRIERQRLLTSRSPSFGDRRSPSSAFENSAGEPFKRSSEEELYETLCIATTERELLVKEKGMLESLLKSTMDEVSCMLEEEAINNEQKRSLESRLREREKQLAMLKNESEQERNSSKQFRDEADQLKEQLKLSERKHREAERACADLEEKVKDLEAARGIAQREMWEGQESKLIHAEATVRQQQERLAEMLHQAAEHAQERAVWQEQRLTLTTKVKEIERLRIELESSKKAEELVTQLQMECADLKQKLHAEQQQRVLDAENKALRQEQKQLNATIAELTMTNATLTRKVEGLEKEVAAAAHEHTEHATRRRIMEAEAAAQAKLLMAATDQHGLLKSQCAVVSRDLEAANRAIDDTKRELALQTRLLMEARKDAERIPELEQTIVQLREDAEKEKAALHQENEDLRHARQIDASALSILQDNLSKLRDFSETLAAEKCALQDDRARLQSRLQLCSRELEYHRSIERASEERSADLLQAHSSLLTTLHRRHRSNTSRTNFIPQIHAGEPSGKLDAI